jgi:hypothetical protein
MGNRIEQLLQHLKEYVLLRMHITELKMGSKASLLASSVLTFILLFMVVFFFILVFTIGIALWISSSIGEWYSGFLIMAALYLVVGFILYIFRNTWVRKPIHNLIVKEIFDED